MFELHKIGCVVVVDVFGAYRMHVVSLSRCLLSQAALGLNPIAGERVVLSVRVDGGPAHVLGTLARGIWPPYKRGPKPVIVWAGSPLFAFSSENYGDSPTASGAQNYISMGALATPAKPDTSCWTKWAQLAEISTGFHTLGL
jgi:hypothetical protein